MTKTKKDLIEHLVTTYHLKHKTAHQIVSEVFTWIKKTVLVKQMKVKIHYFGTFVPKIMKRGVKQNPRTRESIITPKRIGVAFHRSKDHAQVQNETDETESD